jgi:GTP-binding protein EngB required for normal cell division
MAKPANSLRYYEHEKFAIADVLRAASTAAAPDDDRWHEGARDLFVRLAEDRFNLAVVGRFNRGKSSIMNAIMGSDRLPVGIVPLTSIVTTVSYGSKERVVLRYPGRGLPEEAPIDALHRYVTQDGNPGNVRGIGTAEIHLRAEILRRGFHFVDTPGLGSAILENTRTTEAFFPEADALLLVTGYDSPLSEEEFSLIRNGVSSGIKIFVVLNKQDTVSMAERETALNHVGKQLLDAFGAGAPRLFSASAREAMEAKRTQDPPRLAASGITAIEAALVKFLVGEKRDAFLRRMCRRVAELIAALPASAEAGRLSEQIDAFTRRLASGAHMTDSRVKDTCDTTGPDAHQLRSCEICTAVSDALWKFGCTYQHELSINRKEQRYFADSGGFCGFHTWQYHALASPYGISNAYPALLDRLADELRMFGEDTRRNPAQKHPPFRGSKRSGCIFCKIANRIEAQSISALARRLSDEPSETLKTLSAICIPHLAKLSGALRDAQLIGMLADHHAMLLERLSEDMKRFALKYDAARRALESQEEITAHERALLLVAGHRNVAGSHPRAALDFLESAMVTLAADKTLH